MNNFLKNKEIKKNKKFIKLNIVLIELLIKLNTIKIIKIIQ